MRIKSIFWTGLTVFCLPILVFTQNPWTDISQTESELSSFNFENLPNEYRLLELNAAELDVILKTAQSGETCLNIPLPDGGFECFKIEYSSVMHPDLAAKYPHIQTFTGKSTEHPANTMRFVWTSDEFHAMVYTQKGAMFVDKVTKDENPAYMSFYAKDLEIEPYSCEIHTHGGAETDNIFDIKKEGNINQINPSLTEMNSPHAVGSELRTYRFAMSLAGEVTVSKGGVAAALVWVTNRVSDLNALYERTLCVHLELIANNDTLIFPDPATDPYSGSNWLGEARTLIPAMMGSSNYDIGHLIKPTGGGVAYVGVVCNNSYKSGGTSSQSLHTHAHEIGHQMAGGHTFNSCGQYGGGDYEPGSGNTILSYDGLCGSENMPGGGYYQYHSSSFQEMVNHLFFGGGSGCAATSVTGNDPPVVTVPAGGFTIPILTPFKLEGSATDDGGTSALTYSWEQYDNGTHQTPPQNPSGNAPIFQTLPFTSESDRTFPKLSKIINGTSDIGEVLPTYSRDLNFRLMVQDNNPGMGGADYADIQFHVDENAGPFEVLIPNGSNTVWSEGQTRTVTWDVANTDASPVSCANVDILISYDGGFTYPEILADDVPNDGSHDITVPNMVGTQNRIRIEASDNIFFDISDENFEIVSGSTNDFTLNISPTGNQICSETTADYLIETQALGLYNNDIDLTISGLPAGASSNFPLTVAATSSTNLTLSSLNSVADGNYTMTVTATENGGGGVVHSQDIYLVVQGASGGTTPGNAMNFNNSEWINIPQIGNDYKFGKDRNFSVECWIKTTTTSGDDAIFANKDWDNGNYAGWVIAIESGRINFNVGDGSSRIDVKTSGTYNDGEWHHIAGTFDRDNSKARLYIDGHLRAEASPGSLGDINNNLIISIGAAAENDWRFTGTVDEPRVWRKALTAEEVRESMHRTLNLCDTDLISAWQFNEASGNALDEVGSYDATVTTSTRIASTAPIGGGAADTQTEANGNITFTGTDFSANYTTQTGAFVTTTKLNLAPSGTPGVDPDDTKFDDQYWIFNRYENLGSFEANMTFEINEDITADDEANPTALKLYYRALNSDETGSWTFITNANAASDANDSATFPLVPNEGQFLVTRSNDASIGIFISQIDFCKTPLNLASDIKSYEVGGSNLTDNLTIDVSGNFEISLDSLSGYGNQIILTPTGGNINLTKIFVRTIPTSAGAYSGQIDHSSPNAATKSITLNGEGIQDTQDIADDAGNFDGNNDYLIISGLNWQPTVFTVEFWLKPFSFSNWNQRIGSGWGSFLFHANSDASFWTGITTGSHRLQSPAGTLKANQWSHIAVTYDNGTLKVYHNGESIGTLNNVVLPGSWGGNFRLGDTDDDAIHGHLDEFRIWNTARTDQQIRENMHLTMDISDGCENGLICYYQFNDNGDGSVTDGMGTYHSFMQGNGSFITSNVPAAEGVGVEKNVTAAQTYSFDRNNFETSVDINFAAPLPNEDVVISKLTGENAHGTLPTSEVAFSSYWIANNYGDTTALGDITFNVSEDVTAADEAAPERFQVYWRSSNAYGNWTLKAGASSASDANNTVIFSQIPTHGQLLLTKNSTPEITVTGTLTDFGNRLINKATETQSFTFSTKTITNHVTVAAPAGFEISTNNQSGFATSINIVASNGIILDTTIYVRFLPTAAQAYSGNITLSSTGATQKTVAVSGTGKAIGTMASNALSGDSGAYMSIPQEGDLAFGPNQDFTVELWMRTTATNSDPSIISNKNWNSGGNDGWGLFYLGNDWKVNIDGTGGSRVDLGNNGPDIDDGKWHHLAVVFDRDGDLIIYQDGILTNQTSLAGVLGKVITTSYPINVLQDGTGTYSDLTDADIDELRLWNTVRTTSEIRENMHLTLSGTESGLVAYYQFDETTGDCLDIVGGYNGTLENGATRISSDIAAAAGVSVTKDVQTAQNYSFDDGGDETNLDITFSNTLPLGEVVVSNLTGEAPHGISPTSNTLTDSYWVVRNYGTNTSGLDAEMIFETPSNWAEYSTANSYQMHQRASNAGTNNLWFAPVAASSVNQGTDEIHFSGITGFSQFIVSKDYAATCSDGILNGDETAVDCGGSCAPCDNCIFTIIDSQDFESGWGIWTDGGSDASRIDDANFSNSGTFSIRLRDDSETSNTTTGNLDLSAYNEIQVEFSFFPTDFDDANEDFWLQISTDGGSTFTTVEEWNQSDEFENDNPYHSSVLISGPFTTTTQFRFQCDASSDFDWVYLDDVVIKGCEYTCLDGIQNGDEEGVDCGGSCDPCPTCNDGIQNGDETGVDCGGSCSPCAPTTTSCIGTASPTDPVNSGSEIIAVSETLTSTAQITGSANVQYFSAEKVSLMPGFLSDNGTQFKAKIQDCDATCSDGIQNGDETGMDCGGSSCPPCGGATCSDGIQNGDETGTDCGGTYCPSCPTCNDGIQNGDEAGVDCGGSNCAACPAPCLVTQILNTNINSGNHLFNVTDTLTSTATLSGTANVQYFAGKSILLKPGFAVNSGAVFLAKIMTCTPSMAEGNDEIEEPVLAQIITEDVEETDEIETILGKPHILIYPNPTQVELNVQIKTEQAQPVELTVQNALGRMVHFNEYEMSGEYLQASINVSDFAPGMYWLRVKFLDSGEWQVIQFVKS